MTGIILTCLVVAHVARSNIAAAYDGNPIVLLGLPKSGTTSFTFLFNDKLHFKSAHYVSGPRRDECRQLVYPIPSVKLSSGVIWNEKVWKPNYRSSCYFSHQIQSALSQNLPPLHYLVNIFNYTVITQMDCGGCDMYPQVDALQEIVTSYPNAYFIHNVRNVTAHVDSIVNWMAGAYVRELESAGMLNRYPGQHHYNSAAQNVKAMVEHAQNAVRQIFSVHPNMRFLEIDISTDKESSRRLLEFLSLTDFSKILGRMPHRNKNNHKIFKEFDV